MHLVGMNTLLILLSLGPGHHHPRGQDITKRTKGMSTTKNVVKARFARGRYEVMTKRRLSKTPFSN
jgi:uncharacterized membrane protein